MRIEIRDVALEARIQKQLQATGSASLEEVLRRLLETQEEQGKSAGFRRTGTLSMQRRGQGIPEDQLDAHLADLKAKPE